MAGAQISSRFALIVCLLLLVTTTESKRTLRRRGLSQKDYEYPTNSQSTQHQKNDRCPPPPQMLPERACEVTGCRSDSECERHKRCCYNGCIYTCLESVQPPPVLDWLVQPKPRWLGGNGWLLDGPEEVLQAEACSTTEDGTSPYTVLLDMNAISSTLETPQQASPTEANVSNNGETQEATPILQWVMRSITNT